MQKTKLNGFAIFVEVLGFLRIAIVPWILASVVGFIIYGSTKTKSGLVFGILCSLFGLGLGIFWAINVWRKHGTMNFLSAVDASPDLDHIGRQTDDSNQKKEEENPD
jgi:hypothetical protein